MTLRNQGTALLLLVAMAQLSACGSTPPSRFYALSSLAAPSTDVQPPTATRTRKLITVGPVALARYLDHPGITTRSGANGLNHSELDRWGGSLGDELARVLVENLGRLLAGSGCLVLPWLESSSPEYRVQLNVTRFDGPPEGPVQLNATWLLLGRGHGRLLAAGDASLAEPLQGPGYEAMAAAMSRALAELSRRVATEIRRVDREAAPHGATVSGQGGAQ